MRQPSVPAATLATTRATLVVASLLSACAMGLPDRQLVVESRLLAVRIEVLGSAFDVDDGLPARAQVLPLDEVAMYPLFVDPLGAWVGASAGRFDPLWLACDLRPGENLLGCVGRHQPVALDDVPPCPTQELESLLAGEIPAEVGLCLLARAPAPIVTTFTSAVVLAGGGIEVVAIASSPEGTSTDACANRFLGGDFELPDDCIFAVTKIPTADTAQLVAALESLGVDPGTLPFPAPQSDVPADDFDRHPSLESLRVAVLDDEDQVGAYQDVARGQTITIPRGDQLRIEYQALESGLQTYSIPINNGEGVEKITESFSADWLRTWGMQLADQSDEAVGFNVWSAKASEQDDQQPPAGGRATIFLVLRDGRAGVDFWWFNVDVIDPAASSGP